MQQHEYRKSNEPLSEEMRLSMVINKIETVLGFFRNELESSKADDRITDYDFYRTRIADASFRLLLTYEKGGIEPCTLN